MTGRRARGALLVVAVTIAGRPAAAQFTLPPDFVDQAVLGGFAQPVGMAMLPDRRLFVIERETARVRLIVNGTLAPVDPVMTVPDVDADYGEEGLLGIAVDPGWPARPYVYLQYTVASAPIQRIARFIVAGDLGFSGNGALAIDPGSRYDVMADIPHDFAFHNAGTLRFGPDGMLYASLGDPTVCGAQEIGDLFGKILRLDVSGLPPGPGGPAPRALITPDDNPFVAHPDPEARLVWLWGLRNPFRFGIDPATGALAIGDVGGDDREEIDYAATPGMNFEWPIYEGELPGPFTCVTVDSSQFTGPVYAHDHTQGSAVIGGVIYRRPSGASSPFPPEYEGDIFFSDFYAPWLRRLKGSGAAWALAPTAGQPNPTDWGSGSFWISDWLVAPDGALWYCRMLGGDGSGPGEIRRIVYTGVVSTGPRPDADLAFSPPYPSPAAGTVMFDFALPAAGPVSLTIHDLSGRHVRSLVEGGTRSAGPQRATWDRRDRRGTAVPAGVYFARLRAAGRTIDRRMILLQ